MTSALRLSRRSHAKTMTVVLIFVALRLSIVAQSAPRTATSEEEYQVYNALLNLIKLPKQGAHVLIAGKTLDFKCAPEADGPVRINECDGMRMLPHTSAQIMGLLRSEWENVEPSTWIDFEKKNAEGVWLQDRFSTRWKHKLFGTADSGREKVPLRDDIEAAWEHKRSPQHDRSDPATVWDSPDMVYFFSSVGFNSKKTEAIVYAVALSHIEGVPSSGNYFLFRSEGKRWKPDGRVQYMEDNGDGETWSVTEVPNEPASQP